MTEHPQLSAHTASSVAQELCDKGLQQIRGTTRSLPAHPSDATSIFAAGDLRVRITCIDNGYHIDVIDQVGAKIHETTSPLDGIVFTVTQMLGNDALQKLQEEQPAPLEPANEGVAPALLTLRSLQCTINDARSQATILLSIQGPDGERQATFEGEGDGAIEAICTAINKGAGGIVVRFSSLNIVSKASGADAQGAASVRICVGSQNFEAEVVNHNIVRATAEAYVAAMNKAIQKR